MLFRSDRIDAPCLFDGPINGERFRAYVEPFLVPTLKPNDIVILDNLGSHKGKAVRKAVKAAGARLLFLPKYSPDLNPIEQVFAKIKGFVRKAAPRTLDTISHAIAQALAAIKPAECKNYLAGAGYASAQMQNALGRCGGIPGHDAQRPARRRFHTARAAVGLARRLPPPNVESVGHAFARQIGRAHV